jgi:hypothetical protein
VAVDFEQTFLKIKAVNRAPILARDGGNSMANSPDANDLRFTSRLQRLAATKAAQLVRSLELADGLDPNGSEIRLIINRDGKRVHGTVLANGGDIGGETYIDNEGRSHSDGP